MMEPQLALNYKYSLGQRVLSCPWNGDREWLECSAASSLEEGFISLLWRAEGLGLLFFGFMEKSQVSQGLW
jgi:hypothetical protein